MCYFSLSSHFAAYLRIGRACGMSLSGTYRECWERTVGHRGGLGVAVASTLGEQHFFVQTS